MRAAGFAALAAIFCLAATTHALSPAAAVPAALKASRDIFSGKATGLRARRAADECQGDVTDSLGFSCAIILSFLLGDLAPDGSIDPSKLEPKKLCDPGAVKCIKKLSGALPSLAADGCIPQESVPALGMFFESAPDAVCKKNAQGQLCVEMAITMAEMAKRDGQQKDFTPAECDTLLGYGCCYTEFEDFGKKLLSVASGLFPKEMSDDFADDVCHNTAPFCDGRPNPGPSGGGGGDNPGGKTTTTTKPGGKTTTTTKPGGKTTTTKTTTTTTTTTTSAGGGQQPNSDKNKSKGSSGGNKMVVVGAAAGGAVVVIALVVLVVVLMKRRSGSHAISIQYDQLANAEDDDDTYE